MPDHPGLDVTDENYEELKTGLDQPGFPPYPNPDPPHVHALHFAEALSQAIDDLVAAWRPFEEKLTRSDRLTVSEARDVVREAQVAFERSLRSV